jgi:hypothetical protein
VASSVNDDEEIMLALIDGDIVLYRSAASCEPTKIKPFLEPEEIKFLSRVNEIKKDPTYTKEKSSEIKASLLPVLNRRTFLLVNTVRFMGIAKQSGQSLLDYIDKTEH